MQDFKSLEQKKNVLTSLFTHIFSSYNLFWNLKPLPSDLTDLFQTGKWRNPLVGAKVLKMESLSVQWWYHGQQRGSKQGRWGLILPIFNHNIQSVKDVEWERCIEKFTHNLTNLEAKNLSIGRQNFTNIIRIHYF